jgi:hypothetical protein
MTFRMATTTTNRRSTSRGTKPREKDLVTRLSDKGEDAIQRIAELPGGKRALAALNDLRTRVDDMAKKVRGIDALEARIAKLEKQLAEQKTTRKAPARRKSAKRPAPPAPTPPADSAA